MMIATRRNATARDQIPVRAIDLVLLVVFSAIFAVFVFRYWGFVVDDTFISLRYAHNFAEGHGLVFNVGEAPSEGFTSPSWVALLAVADLLGINLVVAAHVLSLTAWLAALALVVLTCMRLPVALSGTTLALVCGLFLVNPRLVSHSLSGMETSLYMLALTAIIYLLVRLVDRLDSAAGPSVGALSRLMAAVFLAGLTRPEGVLFGAICLTAAVVVRPELLRSRAWVAAVLLLGLVSGAYFLARWQYFGHLLPNPYYHKRASDAVLSSIGVDYTLNFLLYALPLLVLCVASSLRSEIRRLSLLFWLPFLTVFTFFFFVPEMGFNMRFVMPYYFLLILLAAPLIEFLLAQLRKATHPRWRTPATTAFAFAFIALQARGLSATAVPVNFYVKSDGPSGNRVRFAMLLSHLPADTVLAAGELGVIPWYSKLSVVDLAGLTDSHLAHHPLSMDYLDQRRVEVLVLPSEDHTLAVAKPAPGNPTGYADLLRLWGEVGQRFQLRGCWDRGNSYYMVFIKRSAMRRDALGSILARNGLRGCPADPGLTDGVGDSFPGA